MKRPKGNMTQADRELCKLECSYIQRPFRNEDQSLLKTAYWAVRTKDLAKPVDLRSSALTCIHEAAQLVRKQSKNPSPQLKWNEEFFRASVVAELVGADV